MKAEVYQSRRPTTVSDDQILATDSLKNQRKKRGWAVFLSVLLIAQIVIAFYYIVLKES